MANKGVDAEGQGAGMVDKGTEMRSEEDVNMDADEDQAPKKKESWSK